MKHAKFLSFLMATTFAGIFVSCGSDDGGTIKVNTDFEIGFQSTTASVAESGAPVTVTVSFASAPVAATLTAVVTGTAVYDTDYTTTPAVSGGEVSMSIAAGATEASFTLTPIDNADDGDNLTVVFTLQTTEGITLGTNSSYTLTITDDDDPIEPGVTVIDEDFETFDDPGGGVDFMNMDWINAAEAGTRLWRLRIFDGSKYPEFTAYNSTEASNIGWLILPKIDFDNLAVDEMSFWNSIGFGDANTELALMHSADFDGMESGIASATWTELSFTVSTVDNEWVESGTIDLSSFSGNGYIAFRYTGDGTNTDNDASYRIDNILVGKSAPSMTVSKTDIDFGSVDNGASAEESFTVQGDNVSGDVTVAAPSNYEVSLTSGSGFAASVMLSDISSAQTVYVKFAPASGVNGPKNGDVVVTAAGLPAQMVAVAGEEAGNIVAAFYTEDFETDGNGTRYTTSVTEFTDGFGDFFFRTDGTTDIGSVFEYSNATGSFFAACDLDGEGGPIEVTITFNDIDISGKTNLQFLIDMAEDDDGTKQDWDLGDFTHIAYDIDNSGTYTDMLNFENDGGDTNTEPSLDADFDGNGDGTTPLTDTFTTFSKSISGTGNTIDIRITISLDSGDEDVAFDNVRLKEE